MPLRMWKEWVVLGFFKVSGRKSVQERRFRKPRIPANQKGAAALAA